ncbi:RraA family protein [Flavobacterium cupreum]|uniref:Regulator of RNase E activity RraA n=2 Tax=Flavobacterium TaxID=237 RepID=A0A4Y7UD70_9FLAO|nr:MULTISPECIES: RraA family protein [Flavobacterium]RUT67972.1 RraA family protein [Flavobacterium cupreum]TCN58997.1 regulator of RNase E activity RraA [Flavobacterium circumlabens]TEB44400.1 RraA family protein [Flavobacterium circumlabens]
MKIRNFLMFTILFIAIYVNAQNVMQSPDYIKALTTEWTGERFADGRPKVSDNLLERLKEITLEEAWAELIEKGYFNQFEGNWKLLKENDNTVMTGRAVTAQFMPSRTDLENQVIEQGKTEGRMWQQKRTVSWAMTTLVEGDFYVADGYDKQSYGTVVGSNLGNGVWARSHRGAIVYGHIRDTEDLRKVEGFNAWVKGTDPSYMRKTLLTSINAPIRIGEATVLPGDAVLAKKDGVIFIPAHLVEHIVLTGEVTELFDIFGQQRIKEGKYTAGTIDSKWSEDIKKDFRSWLNTYKGKLPMSRKELDSFLEKRNF